MTFVSVLAADDRNPYANDPKAAKAGEYEFTGPLTPVQVFEKIVKGEVKQHHFTVPEGLRVDEILPILAGSDLHLDASRLKQLADMDFILGSDDMQLSQAFVHLERGVHCG